MTITNITIISKDEDNRNPPNFDNYLTLDVAQHIKRLKFSAHFTLIFYNILVAIRTTSFNIKVNISSLAHRIRWCFSHRS
jgi:hypothetical protein